MHQYECIISVRFAIDSSVLYLFQNNGGVSVTVVIVLLCVINFLF